MASPIFRFRFKAQSLSNEISASYNLTNSSQTMKNDLKGPGQSDNSWSSYGTGTQYLYNSSASPVVNRTTVYSAAWWYRPDRNSGTATGWDVMLCYGGYVNAVSHEWCFNNNGQLSTGQAFDLGNGLTYNRVAGRWTHITVVSHGNYDAGNTATFDAYVDGVKQTKAAGSGYYTNNYGVHYTAGYAARYGIGSQGRIWDLRHWDYELTDALVKSLYQSYFVDGFLPQMG